MATNSSAPSAPSLDVLALESIERQIADSESVLMGSIHPDDIRELVDRLCSLYHVRDSLMVTNDDRSDGARL